MLYHNQIDIFEEKKVHKLTIPKNAHFLITNTF